MIGIDKEDWGSHGVLDRDLDAARCHRLLPSPRSCGGRPGDHAAPALARASAARPVLAPSGLDLGVVASLLQLSRETRPFLAASAGLEESLYQTNEHGLSKESVAKRDISRAIGHHIVEEEMELVEPFERFHLPSFVGSVDKVGED